MKFTIKFTSNALEHLRSFRKFEQQTIMAGIKEQLTDEPLMQTRSRKPLRENPLSQWELRIREYRIFYDVSTENNIVEIKAVGYKEHNTLFIGGKEFKL
jgi:mRNA-degrading endonuclease RelE of RelBE toxin-antitoxin system